MADRSRNWNQKPVGCGRLSGTGGAALFGALVVALIVSMLGIVSFRLASQEVESVKAVREEGMVKQLAEAGIDLAVQLFHDPTTTSDSIGALFRKRYDLTEGGPSFFDTQGKSQFRGTAAAPDVVFDAANSDHDRLLNDPATGWFRSLRGLGRILRLKVYAPADPALLCTVEVTAASSSGLKRTVVVQLGTRRIPAIRAGAQVAGNGMDAVAPRPLPVWVHWGDLKVRGDARLPKVEDLPSKTLLSSVNALSYRDMFRREDRWLTIIVGGMVGFMPSAVAPPPPQPSNVRARQDPLPGLNEDRWKYDELKKHAIAYGEFYARERDGLLYRDGLIQPGIGVTLETVMHSTEVGDHRGVVFVDTLDQQPPRGDNLGTLIVETDYAEGVFIVNSNLRFKPRGSGRAVSVLSPPNENDPAMGGRISVDLPGIHIGGILSVAGDLTFEERPRIFGAVMTGGQIIAESAAAGPLEIWADFELRYGLVRGMPLVFIAPGTWRES